MAACAQAGLPRITARVGHPGSLRHHRLLAGWTILGTWRMMTRGRLRNAVSVTAHAAALDARRRRDPGAATTRASLPVTKDPGLEENPAMGESEQVPGSPGEKPGQDPDVEDEA